MGDNDRLDRLTEVVERSGAKLVVIGDSAQLPLDRRRGHVERLSSVVPIAQLSEVRRPVELGDDEAGHSARFPTNSRVACTESGKMNTAVLREAVEASGSI